jgi:hypothetical protein
MAACLTRAAGRRAFSRAFSQAAAGWESGSTGVHHRAWRFARPEHARGVRLGHVFAAAEIRGPFRAALSLGLSVLGACAYYQSAVDRASCDAETREPSCGAAQHGLEPLLGVWLQDKPACESLCPFLDGLGMPGARYACKIVDAVVVTLRISLEDGDLLEIVDKTILGQSTQSRRFCAPALPADTQEIERSHGWCVLPGRRSLLTPERKGLRINIA